MQYNSKRKEMHRTCISAQKTVKAMTLNRRLQSQENVFRNQSSHSSPALVGKLSCCSLDYYTERKHSSNEQLVRKCSKHSRFVQKIGKGILSCNKLVSGDNDATS
jgi:hypothetical protein